MRLHIFLIISSILAIGCRGNDIIDTEVASPTPTRTIPVQTIVPPSLTPILSPSPIETITATAPPPEEITTDEWQEYINEDYGFSFLYSDAWSLVERPNMISIVFPGTSIALRIRFRHSDEVVDLQQYGGAAGDFASRGTVNFLGDEVEKVALVYQGVEKEIHYNGTSEISRGDLLFTLAVKSNRNFDQRIIPRSIQATADEILATFKLLGEQE